MVRWGANANRCQDLKASRVRNIKSYDLEGEGPLRGNSDFFMSNQDTAARKTGKLRVYGCSDVREFRNT